MTHFMLGYPWLLWAWPLGDDAPDRHDRQARHDRPARSGRRRLRRLFGRRRADAQGPEQKHQVEEPDDDFAPWPGLRLLVPLTEDDLITFGRELEDTHDVIGRILTEC